MDQGLKSTLARDWTGSRSLCRERGGLKFKAGLNLALLGALERDVSGLCGREELPLAPVPNRLPPNTARFRQPVRDQ